MGSLPVPDWPFQHKRFRLLFNNGPLFYLAFNFRLFLFLLGKPCHLLYANDLDTLGPNYLISKLKSVHLIYDSHELFCEVPELKNSAFKRKIWEALEKFIVPRLKNCVTVNESIAKRLSDKYKVPFMAVRNIPSLPAAFIPKKRTELGLPEDKKILLMQGAGINVDRGAEELILAMKGLEGVLLLIIGSGDVWPELQRLVSKYNLQDKVKLISKLPRTELLHYTCNADLGLSLDKNTNPNYYYSLPNKLFDYLHCSVPILASRLPEIEKIVSFYQIGDFIDSHEPEAIAEKIRAILGSERLNLFKQNTIRARRELNWENEQTKLRSLILSLNAL